MVGPPHLSGDLNLDLCEVGIFTGYDGDALFCRVQGDQNVIVELCRVRKGSYKPWTRHDALAYVAMCSQSAFPLFKFMETHKAGPCGRTAALVGGLRPLWEDCGPCERVLPKARSP